MGPHSDTLCTLQQVHSGVCMLVLPPHNLQTSSIMLKGPKSRVVTAAQDIKNHIQAFEAQLLKTLQEHQQQKHKVFVAVTPSQRCHVISYGRESICQL